jgi:hypothetical protein
MKRVAKRLLNDLDQEIREHIELATQENIARGMTPEEARHAAMLKFGSVTRVKEDTRQVWVAVWLEQLAQDIRFALRGLRRTPAFTVVAILTLAIGIGANTTIFNAINALLLRPLPYPDHDRLVRVSLVDPKFPRFNGPVSWTDVAHWAAGNQVFEQIEAELAPDSAVFGITTVQKIVSDSTGPWSFVSQLLGVFAAVALLLAALGIYGIMSNSVSDRSHELGLRMALGAQPSQVLGLVLRQAMQLSLLGVAIGAAASFLATPVLTVYLYGVKPHDALTLVLVSIVLIAVSLFASFVPARRAASIDPMETLRHE